jgi:heat shock protein HtpX
MDVEPPTVLYTDLDTPNGYALGGPDGGVVVLDVALLSTLEDDGLEALLAHELAHLERGDGLVRMLVDAGLRTAVGVATVASSPGILLLAGVAKASGWLRGDPAAWSRSRAWRLRAAVIAVVTMAPAACAALPLARSRRVEYAADRRAAAVTGDPAALAAALQTVDEATAEGRRRQGLLPVDEEYAPAVLSRLLSTHPSLEERVARLHRLAD